MDKDHIQKTKEIKQMKDEQIRRRINFEFWHFKCPVCDSEGTYGSHRGDDTEWRYARRHGDYKYPSNNYVKCLLCGWEWYDPKYYFPYVQTELKSFQEITNNE